MQKGILSAICAYVVWGLLPLYLKMLQSVFSIEILLNRTLWSLIFMLLLLAARRQFDWVHQLIKHPKTILIFVASAFCIAANWFLYIWAVNSNHVVDASLGYFMLPLANIILGYFFLHERLRFGQWLAVAIAAGGVLWLAIDLGQVPWIALALALTFALYGLLRKIAKIGTLEGLTLEMIALAPLALLWMWWLAKNNQSALISGEISVQLLLIAAGPITAIPLLFFAFAARSIPLHLLGFLQYIGPTLQLLLGIFVWHEAFPFNKMIGFAAVWCALAVYGFEGVLFWHKGRRGRKKSENSLSTPS